MSFTPSRTPPLNELLSLLLEQRLTDTHVATVGKVVRVDSTKGLVDVKPQLQTYALNNLNQRIPVSIPVVPNVPVVWPGGGGFRITFPIAVGDTVLLVIADRSMDRWKSLGTEVDPMSYNLHALTDAIAVPGLRPFNKPLQRNPTDRASFGNDNGQATIEILTNNQVVITGNDVVVNSSTAEINTTGNTSVSASGNATVTATGNLALNGTLVKLNGGVLPIARVGDAIVGTAGPFPISAVIAPPGNPTVTG